MQNTQTISHWEIEKYGEHELNLIADANARLIAAAPELLSALIELERVESSPHSETIRFLAREQAREAIAKAAGQEGQP